MTNSSSLTSLLISILLTSNKKSVRCVKSITNIPVMENSTNLMNYAVIMVGSTKFLAAIVLLSAQLCFSGWHIIGTV